MLPSWIRSSSGTPERRYLTATETTSRRFLSMSVRRAIRSPARTLLPSSTSSRCVRRATRDMRLRYADNGSGTVRSRAGNLRAEAASIIAPCRPPGDARYQVSPRIPSMSTLTTSGRENSGGGYSPLPSISLTFVPEKKTCASLPCGHVLVVAIPSQLRQKKACSKKSGVMPNSSSSNSSKMCCVVGAVVAADSGVISAHDEVRAAVVLAADRVEDRLTRACIPHRRREHSEDRPAFRVVAVEDDLVAHHPDRSGDIVRLGLADEGV